jgi:hypothetical protein
MTHPSPGLLFRLARLLDPPGSETPVDVLLSAALLSRACQLTPLVLLVDRDTKAQFERAFSKGVGLDDRHQIAAILRELASHHAMHTGPCQCVALARSIGPFAYALTGVDDRFYRRLGEILLDDVVRELDPAADPRRTDDDPAWAIRPASIGESLAT